MAAAAILKNSYTAKVRIKSYSSYGAQIW